MAAEKTPGAGSGLLTLEVIDGISRGVQRSFEVPAGGTREISIGRGDADFPLAADDRAVGRGAHLRLRGPASGDGGAGWELANEHKNRVFLRSASVEAPLEKGDRIRFRTPGFVEFLGGGPTIRIGGPEDPERTRTRALLERSGIGDPEARRELLAEHMDWIRAVVRKRLGPALRRRVDSMDMMQEAAMRALEHGPRFVVSDESAFRAVMCRIIENTIRDENDKQRAKKRDLAREKRLQANSAISLDLPAHGGESPSGVAMRIEQEERLALALRLLEPADRGIIELRDLDELSFKEIGERLDLGEDAARMRYNRAKPRLRDVLDRLARGEIDESIGRE